MMEGVAREWRVRVQDAAGNVLDPAGFSFYGAAADGVQVPRRMQVRVDADVAVLVLPGLWMSGRCWRYQVLCQDVLTGVEWVLCQGDVVLERRVACNGPALHEDAVLVDAVLDSELENVEVFLGDSTAASAEAARRAEASREAAEAEAARAGDAAAKAEDLKRVALDAAAGAALSAERAADSKRGAEAAAGDAAADAQVAEGKAAEAEESRVAAVAAQRQAEAKAAEAEAGAKVAADAVSDALAARDEAVAAQRGAEAAQVVAEDASAQAGRYAEQAVGASDGAVVAQGKAEAAQVVAEAKAAEAVVAAEAVLQPESVAVQAARPAVLLLVREELLGILGDASLFDLDTDGQKIIVHTDSISDEQLAIVTAMLERFVPGFIEVVQYNHNMEISWETMYKYRDCKNVIDLNAVNATWYKELVTGVIGENKTPYANYGWYYFPNFIGGNPLWESIGNTTYKFAPYNIYIYLPALETLTIPLASDGAGGILTKAIHAYIPNLKTVAARFFSNQSLEVLDCELPMLEDAPQFSIFQKINKESAIKMLDSLPAYTSGTHRFRLGISKGVVGDEDVIAATSRAEEKGWTLTIEYRTPSGDYEPLTYGLRSDTIYAKIGEIKLPNGEVQQFLDWGHYVTDPTGYEEFRSVEAAREYYGLPDEDLTETE